MPTMERCRVLTPTQDCDIKELLEEIKARQNNKEESLDYVLGLISTSHDAKQKMAAGQHFHSPLWLRKKDWVLSSQNETTAQQKVSTENEECVSENLTCLNVNIRSLSKHFDELQAQLLPKRMKPTVIGLTETWLETNDMAKIFRLKGYNNRLLAIGIGVSEE